MLIEEGHPLPALRHVRVICSTHPNLQSDEIQRTPDVLTETWRSDRIGWPKAVRTNSALLLGSQTPAHRQFVPSDSSDAEIPTPFVDCCAALVRCRMEDSGTEVSSCQLALCTQLRCRGRSRFPSGCNPRRDRSRFQLQRGERSYRW